MDLEEQYNKIFRYCYFRIGNDRAAEDLTQETFLRFYESRGYEDAGRPLAYLYTIARNLCVDFYRKQTPLLVSDWNEEAFRGLLAQEGFEEQSVDRLALHAALLELTEDARELLLLRCVEGLSYSQLALICGKSRFALMRELKKITQSLERRLSDEKGA